MATRLQGKLLGQRALFQRLQSNKKRGKLAQAGFTLIEILIAVVILGVLSAIALPQFLNVQKETEKSAAASKAVAECRELAAVELVETGKIVTNVNCETKAP